MINRRAILIFTSLALLALSSCLPQSQPEPAQQHINPATSTQQPIAPSPTAPSTATRPAIPSPASTTSPATTPSATIMPQDESVPATPELIEEIHLTMEPTMPSPTNPAIEGWITQAKEDLANRLAISVSDIERVSFEEKVWPNPGMGCPHPGMKNKQIPVDGYLIRLRYGKQAYNYHGGGGRPPFLCENKVFKDDSFVPSPGIDT